MPRWVAWFFFSIGVMFLTGAIAEGYSVWKVNHGFESASGTVLRTTATGPLGLDFKADIEFTTPDGKSHTFPFAMSSINSLQSGQQVKVRYREDQPEQATLALGSWPYENTALLSGWAALFLSMGGGMLLYRLLKRRRNQWLQLNGTAIQAAFTGVELNRHIEVNDRNPYQLAASWTDPANGQSHIFKSEFLWEDPTPNVQSTKYVTVVIDPRNPKRYWMDTTFLPKE